MYKVFNLNYVVGLEYSCFYYPQFNSGSSCSCVLLKIYLYIPIRSTKNYVEQAVQSNRTNLYVNVGMIYLINIFNSIVEIISKVFELPAIFIYLLSIIWSNRQLLFLLLAIGSLAFSIHTNGDSILNTLDNAYRCAVLPLEQCCV